MVERTEPAWWLLGEGRRVALGPYVTEDEADAANPLDERRLDIYDPVYGIRRDDGTVDERVSPEMRVARERYQRYVHEQLNAAVPLKVFDAVADDPQAALLVDVATTIVHAGLTLAGPHSPVRPDGVTAAGVGLGIADQGPDGERVVMVTWCCGEDARFETGRILLPAVADVLRANGFTVEDHWSRSGTQLVTGRTHDSDTPLPSVAVHGMR
jgi:hypothetical protein